MEEMTVSELADRTGTTADTLRYYERIGLLGQVARSPAGYRLFGEEDAERVSFIRRAQGFGLSLEEIAELLAIRDRGLCPCGHARRLLADRLEELDRPVERLGRLRDDIRSLLGGDLPRGDTTWPCGPLTDVRSERRGT